MLLSKKLVKEKEKIEELTKDKLDFDQYVVFWTQIYPHIEKTTL